MRAQLFSVYQKVTVNDPQWAKEQGKNVEVDGSVVSVYQHLFSTTDEEHAKFACRNEDGRLVFTSQTVWFGELA